MSDSAPQLLRHHRPFIAFWLARVFTASGFQMLTVAIGWNLYQLTGNVLDLGLVGLVEFAPRVLFMLHTGHVADRYDRRKVAALCQSLQGLIALALAAEQAGVQMLTVHGRTREQGYKGQAEHDTVAHIKSRVRIPVVANGDIDSPEKARDVLRITGADAVMVGRAAQGSPWIFREINHFLETGGKLPTPQINEIQEIMNAHLIDHYEFYGEYVGLRTARKHIGWYCKGLRDSHAFRQRMNTADDCKTQLQMVNDFFDEMKSHSDRLLFLEAA